jgi:ubiquinone/menaquinone biosynthesis C-methylase UbiE
MPSTGWEQSRRVHFDEIVEDYDRIRPPYPSELFRDMFAYIGSKRELDALEIGAGTGKATQSVLSANHHVTAVELGENMSAFLLHKFRENQHFQVITSSFEDVPLKADSYDVIYAASAFHWVDAKVGCPKVFRLLRDNGVFALMRFNWVPADNSEIVAAIQAAYVKHYESHYGKGPRKLSREEYSQPVGIQKGFGFEDMRDYGFTDVVCNTYDVVIPYTADEYIQMLDTMSDHRALPSSNREALYTALQAAIVKNGGQIKQGYLFQLYMGRKGVVA